MNPLLLVTFLAVSASATYYGQAQPQINVRVEDVPRQQVYSAPAPQRQDSYSSSSSSYDSNLNQPVRQQIPILRFDQDIRGSLSNNVQFETGNGIRSSMNTQAIRGNGGEYVDENGRLTQSDTTLEQSGHSYHEAPEGGHISLTWTADKNGFHPTGDHLPQPVPMPAEHAEAHRQALAAAASSGSSYSSGESSYSRYSAPQQPAAIRVQSYSAPQQPAAIRVGSYSAPQEQSVIRVQSYDVPAMRSAY